MNVKTSAELLRKNDNFLILTHTRPDGDTLGSAAALCLALRRLGKSAWLFRNTEITPKYAKYLSEELFCEAEPGYTVAVDIADTNMLPKGFTGSTDLCIDHHGTNSHYAPELLLGADKASCGEVVLELIKELCGSVTAREADLLYIAVSTDCGCFRYANVTYETLEAASELARYGADLKKLNFELFRQQTRARVTLEGKISAGLRFLHGGAVVIATVSQELLDSCGATENDCDDLAGIAGRVEGCIVSVTVREQTPTRTRVSVRSQPSFNSAELCRRFGGGGHDMAAGCTIDSDLETVTEMLISAIDEAWG